MQTINFQWTLVSISLTAVAIIICVFAMGAGHGTYIPAIVTFPFSMLVASWYKEINLFSVLLAIIQFPMYGLAMDFVKGSKWKWLTLAGIIVLHIIVVNISIHNKGDTF